MARSPSAKPTELELQILGVLWAQKECTVRQIHNRLLELRGDDYGYANTVKMLHVMLEKGLIDHDVSIRPKTYRAKASQKRTQRSMLGDLVQRVYDGSSASVILQALTDKKISKDELSRIRKMIDELEDDS